MAPSAYGLRDHIITREPVRVDLSQTELIETPSSWKHVLEAEKVPVLPLLDGENHGSPSGWCTYTYEHVQAPELEIICGGVNAKTPLASGIWRQGHLLHFGFEQSPSQLNANGRALLINSICYIAKFTEDRPIVRTPSIFYSRVRIFDRNAIARLVANQERDLQQFLDNYLAPDSRSQTKELDREGVAQWFEQMRPFLRADQAGKLSVDGQAQQFGVPPDRPEFFEQAIAALSDGPEDLAELAPTLLNRYAPDGPGVGGSTNEWTRWWGENRNYLFFSDTGGYRWYVDPLAKKRGISTMDLRGPSRATHVQLDEPTENDPVVAGAAVWPSVARPGDEMTLAVRIRTAPRWHVYAMDRPTAFGIPTKLDLDLPDGLQPMGEWSFPAAERTVTDFGDCFIYRGDVTFSKRLKLSPGTAAEILNVTCRLEYQVCNETVCLPPKRVTLTARLDARR